ncbi:hypothetical protein [Microbacterium sp.]|uniref:hypothetical protein n=1 Tax=Microbacterium sp. TaxID=51671 RepID=UPI0039E61EC0
MEDRPTETDLARRLPALIAAVAEIERPGEHALRATVIASGLPIQPDPDQGRASRSGRQRFDFPFIVERESTAFERTLRAAVSRTVGRASGSDKHWDAGSYAVVLTVFTDAVEVTFTPQLSVTRLVAAAADWLGGMDARAWLVAYDIRAADDAAPSVLHLPAPKVDFLRAKLHSRDAEPLHVQLYMGPGPRVPGSTAKDDDSRYDEILALLTARLGETPTPGWWRSGLRTFKIARMRTYTRTVTFSETAPGKVRSALGRVVDAPRTPEPVPAEAVALLKRFAAFRAQPIDDVIAALQAEGVLSTQEPEQLRGLVRVCDPAGRAIALGTVDGRFARASVEAATAPIGYSGEDKNEPLIRAALQEAFGPQLGESTTRRWEHGPMIVQYDGRGTDHDFPRTRLAIGEDRTAVYDVGRWLTDGVALPDIPLRDAWHARCFGAAISGGSVPAMAAGMPVWRVDERLLWLDADRVRSAGPGQWPEWAPSLGGGGTLETPTSESLARFVEVVSGWRWPSVGEVWAELVDLGWATNDPDTVTQSSPAQVRISLRRPAGRYLALQLVDGQVEAWFVELAVKDQNEQLIPIYESMQQLLEPYLDEHAPGAAHYTVGQTAITLDRVRWGRGGGTVSLAANKHLSVRP